LIVLSDGEDNDSSVALDRSNPPGAIQSVRNYANSKPNGFRVYTIGYSPTTESAKQALVKIATGSTCTGTVGGATCPVTGTYGKYYNASAVNVCEIYCDIAILLGGDRNVCITNCQAQGQQSMAMRSAAIQTGSLAANTTSPAVSINYTPAAQILPDGTEAFLSTKTKLELKIFDTASQKEFPIANLLRKKCRFDNLNWTTYSGPVQIPKNAATFEYYIITPYEKTVQARINLPRQNIKKERDRKKGGQT
jgi:hypothetical protein